MCHVFFNNKEKTYIIYIYRYIYIYIYILIYLAFVWSFPFCLSTVLFGPLNAALFSVSCKNKNPFFNFCFFLMIISTHFNPWCQQLKIIQQMWLLKKAPTLLERKLAPHRASSPRFTICFFYAQRCRKNLQHTPGNNLFIQSCCCWVHARPGPNYTFTPNPAYNI